MLVVQTLMKDHLTIMTKIKNNARDDLIVLDIIIKRIIKIFAC